MSNFDCFYLYCIRRHAFHFLTLFVFKLFCFGNIRSDTYVQYSFVNKWKSVPNAYLSYVVPEKAKQTCWTDARRHGTICID